MRAYIYMLISIITLLGCTKTIYVPQINREIIIDTLVRVEPDSSVIKALLDCDSTGQVLIRELSTQKGENASSELEVKGNTLTSQTRWKTQVVDRMVEVRDTTTVVEIREVVREVTNIPTFYRWCLGIAIIAVGTGILKIVLWLKG